MDPPDPGRRLRRVRAPKLPDASSEFVLRSHQFSTLILELAAAVVLLVITGDALASDRWLVGVVAPAVALSLAGVSIWAYRRSTGTTPQGLVIRGWGDRTIPWADIDGFEILPHRTGRRDQIAARVDDELVSFPHPDAKSLALRPHQAGSWYRSLIERIEARRPSVG
jgi:hypothetical protein